MTQAYTRYQQWLQKVTDPQIKQQLEQMDQQQIENCFYKELEFGTGGLRGIMGAGSNCLNTYTIIKATAGVATYMVQQGLHSVAITYDSRNNSQEFSNTTAQTLASYGLKVYITKECMPTPFVSFAIRHLGCDMGINVTASHNPKQYNGYKVYDSNGCQVLDEVANEITEHIGRADAFDIVVDSFDSYVQKGLICFIEPSVEEAYVQSVLDEGLGTAEGLSVAYSPLNGAGYRITPAVLRKCGLTQLDIVEQQSYPNGNFDTCPYPNPEKLEALTLVLELARQKQSDLVVANDPDCDRLGVAVKQGDKYVVLTGNEVGILLVDYILSTLSGQNKLPANPIVVKTIVTSVMVDAICNQYGAEVKDVLTGFKYIGNIINGLQAQGQTERYVFGFEESCGYLKGSYVRDKDGVVASMLVCQMAAHYKKLGLTLCDKLAQLYNQHGLYQQSLLSYKFEGADGAVKKQQLLDHLRANPLATLASSAVTSVEDLLGDTDLPKADVLIFRAEDGSKVIVRPSGTEPLIKCYLFVCGNAEDNKAKLAQITAQLDQLFGN